MDCGNRVLVPRGGLISRWQARGFRDTELERRVRSKGPWSAFSCLIVLPHVNIPRLVAASHPIFPSFRSPLPGACLPAQELSCCDIVLQYSSSGPPSPELRQRKGDQSPRPARATLDNSPRPGFGLPTPEYGSARTTTRPSASAPWGRTGRRSPTTLLSIRSQTPSPRRKVLRKVRILHLPSPPARRPFSVL